MVALIDSIAARSQRKRPIGRDGTDSNGEGETSSVNLTELKDHILPILAKSQTAEAFLASPRGQKAEKVAQLVKGHCKAQNLSLNPLQERNLITALIQARIKQAKDTEQEKLQAKIGKNCKARPVTAQTAPATPTPQPALDKAPPAKSVNSNEELVKSAVETIRPILLSRMDVAAAAKLSRAELAQEITELSRDALRESKIQLNALEIRNMVTFLVNDMTGLGPLEILLADDAITDIMINGPKQIYVEKGGKLTLSEVTFRDNAHVMSIATRIVSNVGRRVDESSPLCDARLDDGSRVNIIIPPLAIDGPSISIRKFSEKKITLEMMAENNTISDAMLRVLQIASRCRLNVLISGGTGSGKTTTLNAMSRMIDLGERVVTIEDAAELQLQQPHVVRLETRPPNLEGKGEITMRDLVKNALRMRPDRIILGEVRGSESLDMLQAMNTGHEGSMGTIHANNAREALTRLENMIAMGGFNLPQKAMRQQIASAVDMVLQVSRMRDGKRRITSVSEVVGMEGDIITLQELFAYKFEGEDADGNLIGAFESSGLRPNFAEKARYFGLDKPLLEAIKNA